MRLLVGLSIAFVVFSCTPASAQHLGAREQWQPQFTVGGWDADRRIHAPVALDLLGRSAASVLAQLSDQTGVSLQIAPENTETVGERKLSLFVREAELKSVMVQIPEALRECHWDIDRSREEPVYYLHRNANGADITGDSDMERLRNKQRARRVERLEATRRALAMSPEELRDFEKEDLALALAMQEPVNRDEASLFFALSPDQLQELTDTGRVQPRYGDLSPEAKVGFARLLERMTRNDEEVLRRVDEWHTNADARVDFVDAGDRGLLGVGLPGVFLSFPIPRPFPTEGDRWGLFSTLMGRIDRSPGTDLAQAAADAESAVSEWIAKMRIAQAEELDSSQYGKGHEPEDPVLLQPVSLRPAGPTDLSELQREIARITGLNLVADYFSPRPIGLAGGAHEVPLWQALNILGAESDCIWRKKGSYLIFHHADWQGLVPGEIPATILDRYRQSIADAGHLTIDDAAEFALAWEGKDVRAYGIPMDLQQAGLTYGSPPLLLYAVLTPEQATRARRPEGLPCTDLTALQCRRFADLLAAHNEFAGSSVTMEEALSRGTFHVEETVLWHGLGRHTPKGTDVVLFLQIGEDRPRVTPGHFDFPEINRPAEAP